MRQVLGGNETCVHTGNSGTRPCLQRHGRLSARDFIVLEELPALLVIHGSGQRLWTLMQLFSWNHRKEGMGT